MPKIRKEHFNKEFGNVICKNCDNLFSGNFCPNCGQSIKEFRLPISFLVIDLVGNMIAFDTRFWKTLKEILFQPGKMTNDYLQGKRIRVYASFSLLYIYKFRVFFTP